MKHLLFLSMVVFSVLASCAQAPQSPKASAEGNGVKVNYGQPSKRDRVIFGKLVPYGEVWRTGANEATEITFTKDVNFGGAQVKAGTYTLFTIPTEKDWTVILNSQLKQWGAYDYEKYKNKDVAKIKVPSSKTENVVEKLTYRFTPANDLVIEWDQTRISIPIK